MYHEQNVREGAAEICSIYIVAFFLGNVDFLASRTVNFDPRCSDLLAHTDGKHWLAVA